MIKQLTILVLLGLVSEIALGQTSLGMVGLKSTYGRYLQAHTDGEMHASNDSRNEEETWFLYEVDSRNHIYALLNWRNGRFVSKHTDGCAPATSTTLAPSEQWVMESGKAYGVLNAFALRNVADDTYLETNDGGHDGPCGGEVSAQSTASPPRNDGGWRGWWVMEAASQPSQGRDFWNTVGGAVQGIVNKLSSADVAAILALL